MDKQTIKNHKLDIESMLKLIEVAIEKQTKGVQRYANFNEIFKQMFLAKHEELLIIATQCKENMAFIYDVLDNQLLESEIIQKTVANPFYSPRKIGFLIDIGKYRTETLKIKRSFESLARFSRMKGASEREVFFKECVSKLNYVYSNIAKLAK